MVETTWYKYDEIPYEKYVKYVDMCYWDPKFPGEYTLHDEKD